LYVFLTFSLEPNRLDNVTYSVQKKRLEKRTKVYFPRKDEKKLEKYTSRGKYIFISFMKKDWKNLETFTFPKKLRNPSPDEIFQRNHTSPRNLEKI
jgi:hypothetical protein